MRLKDSKPNQIIFFKVGMSNFGFLGCNPKPTITKVISHFMAKWAQDDPPLKENKDL